MIGNWNLPASDGVTSDVSAIQIGRLLCVLAMWVIAALAPLGVR
jgi:hypothetical protein